MIATATHDTKRGEDARARLNALSEMPDAWAECPRSAGSGSAGRTCDCRRGGRARRERPLPDPAGDPRGLADGAPRRRGARPRPIAAFRERIEEYRHEGAAGSQAPYELGARGRGLRGCGARPRPRPSSTRHRPSSSEFRPLARRLAFVGMLTGLARTVLKATMPGVPDIYQGTEMWDLSLVDPDNRRPVDYEARIRALDANEPLGSLLAHWRDGRIKQRVLASRFWGTGRRRPAFTRPATISPSGRVVRRPAAHRAFARRPAASAWSSSCRGSSRPLAQGDEPPLGRRPGATRSCRSQPGRWRDVITGPDRSTWDRRPDRDCGTLRRSCRFRC